MSRFTDPSDKVAEPTPPGVYFGVLKGMDDWESKPGGQYQNDGPQIKWIFGLKGIVHANEVRATKDNPEPKQPEDFIGEEIWGFTGNKMTPNAKARTWAEALLDTTFEEGDAAPEDDDLIGKWATIYVGSTATGRHKIEKLEPYRAPKRSKRAAAADDEPERELATAGATTGGGRHAPTDDDELDF